MTTHSRRSFLKLLGIAPVAAVVLKHLPPSHGEKGPTGQRGSNIVLYGETHPTKAGEVHFRTGSNVVLMWDNSASHWDFTSA